MTRKRSPLAVVGFIYGVIILIVLYLPVAVLIAFSFNTSRLNVVWQGFTLQWYQVLFRDGAVWDAFRNTLFIGIASMLVATVIGTLVAVGMYRYRFPGKSALDGLLYTAIVIPSTVLGIALLAFFTLCKVPLGMLTMIIAHVTFCMPFVALVVKARLAGFDPSLEEAALDLGASPWQAFLRVTLPIIMPGVLAGALLAFTLSIDDVTVSFFVSGPGGTTLPLKIYAMVREGVTPAINALSAILILLTLMVTLAAEGLRKRAD